MTRAPAPTGATARRTTSLLVLAAVLTGCAAPRPTASPARTPTATTPAATPAVGSAAARTPVVAPTFGPYPTYLPKGTTDRGALHTVVDATPEHPALATQGDSVRVHLPDGTAQVTVVGPAVADSAVTTSRGGVPATWTVTLQGLSGTLPLAVPAFATIDRLGTVYRLSLRSHGPLPTQLRAGRRVTFRLGTSMLAGEGRLRWIPRGHLAPVEWAFALETA